MVLLGPLLVIATAAAAVAAFVLFRWPSFDPASPRVGRLTAETTRDSIVSGHGVRAFLVRRTNPKTVTGLTLTAALGAIFAGVIVVGMLALLVHVDSSIVDVDRDVEQWAAEHASGTAIDVLDVLTELGATVPVIVIGVLVAAYELVRRFNRWLVPFFVVVLVGESVITYTIKELMARVRPDLNPTAHFLGPSFPSGHTATAAAFWAAVALVIGRGRSRRTHALLTGAAVGVAVAVACTRVLLGVHWLSDVIAGLALGWAWFVVCSIAFGGRLLVFAMPARAGERAADLADASPQ